MRKDLRLGLGIGALALLFAVTFLVVRNHTENQATEGVDAELVVVDGAGPPLPPNLPVAAPGAEGAQLPTVILPPLQAVPPGDPASPPSGDPWVKQAAHTPEAPMPGAAHSASRNGASWDLLLNEGRREPSSSTALSRTPDPTISRDPVRDSDDQPAPAPRRGPVGGELSAATGRAYTIRSGDTFSSLAKETYGAEKYYLQIERANPNVNTLRLRPGQQIILPELSANSRSGRSSAVLDRDSESRPISRDEYRVEVGDSLYRISMNLYGTPRMMDSLYEANRSAIGSDPDRLRLGMILRLPQEPGAGK